MDIHAVSGGDTTATLMQSVREDERLRAHPFNVLRNAAVRHARSDWVLYLEADMLLPAAHERLRKHLPRFAAASGVDGTTPAWILLLYNALAAAKQHAPPDDKADLLAAGYNNSAYGSHAFMDYAAWLRQPAGAGSTVLDCPKCGAPSPGGKLCWAAEPYYVGAAGAGVAVRRALLLPPGQGAAGDDRVGVRQVQVPGAGGPVCRGHRGQHEAGRGDRRAQAGQAAAVDVPRIFQGPEEMR